ncbi:hypothetical protein OHC33_002455 [Knufia fluminis]|uniref:Uncharacterized protein n=2 Tax=Knufia TaxID=430999 RepID=A0AAN8FEL2_9EURO|nr:hypothetical protein OHC33_002455 [Knufia fluminis]
MDATQLQHLSVVLTHLNDATVDWAEVAKERGISRKDNALTSFKQLIKKHGLEYTNNKFNAIAGFDASADGAAGGTPKVKKARTPRKRKSEDEDGDDKQEKASATKKQKAKKAAEGNLKEDKEGDTEDGVKDESD